MKIYNNEVKKIEYVIKDIVSLPALGANVIQLAHRRWHAIQSQGSVCGALEWRGDCVNLAM